MEQDKIIVTIPVYKEFEDLSEDELASFVQCFRILGKKYIICIVYATGFEVRKYVNHVTLLSKTTVKTESFDPIYFQSLDGYNSLLLATEFYYRFKEYEYLLIYQLDCWIFRDELQKWCEQGYDYVGAPMFTNFGRHEEGSKLSAIGNGGFSLRKISRFIQVLTWKKNIKSVRLLMEEFKASKSLKAFLLLILKIFRYHNSVPYLLRFYKRYKINEDIFYSYEFGKGTNISILVPPIDVAIKFSFDRSPNYIYELNNNQLPFGCHGWSRMDEFYSKEDKVFWKKFIKPTIN